MGSGRPQGSIQKVITTLEFLSVCSGPVRDIYAHWDRRREGRRMPSRTDINPADFAGHLPGIVFVEVQRDPPDYVYRSVGAGIDGKKQPGILEMLVKLLAGDAGLDGDVQILGADPQDIIHLAEIKADAAMQGGHMTLQRCSRAEGYDRRAVPRTGADDLADFLGRPGKGDGIGRMGGVIGFIMAMLLAHSESRREAVTEERLQFGKQGRMGVVTGQRRCCFHGSIPRATNLSSAPAAAIGSRSRSYRGK